MTVAKMIPKLIEIAIGMNPAASVIAVASTGRSRRTPASTMAPGSSRTDTVHPPVGSGGVAGSRLAMGRARSARAALGEDALHRFQPRFHLHRSEGVAQRRRTE